MTERGRTDQIREMFDRIASGYDRQNTVFSLDRDRAWRRRAARLAGLRPGDVALDLCTGTGKLAAELLPDVRPGGRVIGLDFSTRMLELARRQVAGVEFQLGDVMNLPFGDASIDAVTIAFGLRNLVDRERGLREMFRVLKPGGRLVVLEFRPPPRGPLSLPYRFYLTRVMPGVAGWFGMDRQAYQYLADTVQGFPSPTELARLLEQIGFRDVQVRRMTGGIVALHRSVRLN
ncbi:MAG TPA: bifunctional demethylmenaquinone methyltransferase/2-methoxy-6-polyprenyl-1,4-benzoquinol methylase UbiE [Candidatus Eisenbacteria bacterium]|nr:bifunctional demethylmenaquinone methyltransferase/2-methoxy-6-polyprenyl-1,4-benzoquinol methylase UbiE [Candidatus Eisenbacteria bacterium]